MEPVNLAEAMLTAGRHHGANVARVARALAPHRGDLLARGNVSPTPELGKAFASGEIRRDDPPAGFVSGTGFGDVGD